MPEFVEAGLWGLLVASGLLIGAVIADLFRNSLSHRVIASIMGFGGGVLIAVISLDLMTAAMGDGEWLAPVGGGIAGAACFSFINWRLAARGAQHRNRCGDCVSQPKESERSGSGLAIAVGAVLDGIPEALVVGLSVVTAGTVGPAAILGFFLANVPQGLSSATGMRSAGRSRYYIYAVWTIIPMTIALSAALGALLFGSTSGAPPAAILGFAAGSVVAMLAEAMIPEAFADAPPFIGLATAAGYLATCIVLMAH